ncbi:MAG: permease [Spirochaetales bacterium]|nr:permease [Spirochaetales bacterium]
MDTIFLYGIALLLFILSFAADRQKTKKAFSKGLKALEGILPQFIAVVALIAIMLALLEPQTISRFIGSDSGPLGVILAGLIGSITLIPGFVAFPLAGELLKNGAGTLQIATFVSSLMMVGVITLPVEISYFGKRAAVLRNLLALAFSFAAAFFVAWAAGI